MRKTTYLQIMRMFALAAIKKPLTNVMPQSLSAYFQMVSAKDSITRTLTLSRGRAATCIARRPGSPGRSPGSEGRAARDVSCWHRWFLLRSLWNSCLPEVFLHVGHGSHPPWRNQPHDRESSSSFRCAARRASTRARHLSRWCWRREPGGQLTLTTRSRTSRVPGGIRDRSSSTSCEAGERFGAGIWRKRSSA